MLQGGHPTVELGIGHEFCQDTVSFKILLSFLLNLVIFLQLIYCVMLNNTTQTHLHQQTLNVNFLLLAFIGLNNVYGPVI
jgi:hypothetical protein